MLALRLLRPARTNIGELWERARRELGLVFWLYVAGCACVYGAVVPFYENLGFVSDPEGIKGMFLYP